MKERMLDIGHKTMSGCLLGLTALGVYHTSVGVYGIITRRIAYQNSLKLAETTAAAAAKK